MTHEERDQVVNAWLAEGPHVAPRGIAAGLPDRIAGQRQRPGWLVGRLPERQPLMMAAASVAAIVVVGLAVTLANRPTERPIAAPPLSTDPTPASQAAVPSETLTPSLGAPINPDRQPCLEGYSGCLGPLAAGSHIATHFRVGFDVPGGWTNAVDTPDWLLLGPQDAAPFTWIAMLRNAVISGQNASCTPEPRPELGRTVDEVVTYLSSHPGLVMSQPTPVTIGGLTGQRFDVSIAPSWTQACPFNGAPTVQFLTQDRADPGWFWVIDPNERQRLALLDDGSGGIIVVAINAPSAAAFDPLLHAADPILASLTFEHGEPRSPAPPSSSP